MALSMQACGRAPSVQPCRAGAVMEKPALVRHVGDRPDYS